MSAEKKISNQEGQVVVSQDRGCGESLIASCMNMRLSLQLMKDINGKTENIALNASIEAARARGKFESFSIVAEQIHTQAARTSELCKELENLMTKLQDSTLYVLASRYFDLADNIIDKLDRNLFERSCDVQAWATFEAIVLCATAYIGTAPEKIINDQQENIKILLNASKLLNRLTSTYVVYADAYLLNNNGIVIASGFRQDLIGKDFSNSEWFQKAFSGSLFVSEMEMDKELKIFTVSYSAPVVSAEGSIIGVVTTRFNWDYAQEIIDHAGLDKNTEAFFFNKSGDIIGSSGRIGIMKDTISWLDAGKLALQGQCGFTVESARNGVPLAVGYSRTKGYNSYKGKEWSAIVYARLQTLKNFNFLNKLVTNRLEANSGSSQDNCSLSERLNLELLELLSQIGKITSEIQVVSNEASMLAINASIQAGIAGIEGEGFAVIASEIGKIANQGQNFILTFLQFEEQIRSSVSNITSARTSDTAYDAIDKVTRNIFERYCDVQSWTSFPQIVKAACEGDEDGAASKVLAHLHKVYEVYYDIFLLNHKGQIVASSLNSEMVGQNQSNRKWFKQALSGKVDVTEVYFSDSVNNFTMTFSAPIIGIDGSVVGVLSTRFNWSFICDILKAMNIDSNDQIYLVNEEGIVIATPNKQGILKKNLASMESFRNMSQGKTGWGLDKDPQDERLDLLVGYSTVNSYNTYKNKGWGVLICKPFRTNQKKKDFKIVKES